MKARGPAINKLLEHSVELETRLADDYLAECAAQGLPPAPPYRTECLRWRLDRDGLPGKRRFDLARRALGSRAEAVVQDFMLADLLTTGTFDRSFEVAAENVRRLAAGETLLHRVA